jgi:hypothetical protein
MISFDRLASLSGGKRVTDAACPLCGPECRSPTNRVRKVLRIWNEGNFITFNCERCDAH